MYNSLTPSLRKSDEPYTFKSHSVFPPPPPRIPAPPPPPLLSDSPPPVPPPFVPPVILAPLPPVFAPDSKLVGHRSDLAWNSLKQNLLFQKQKITELETKFALWQDSREVAVETRPKRAYTEGGIPSEQNSQLLYAKLIRHQSQKNQLVQSITHLETYISQQSPHERDFDFNLDKCLDNASRKLKKNKNLLKKTEIQIVALEEQLPSDMVFSLHRPSAPSTISYSTPTKKKRFFSKKPLLVNLKKRSKTWPFS